MYDYATKTYVDNSFNFVNNQLIDIKSKNYVEKETYDEDIDRVWDKADYALDLANECFDEIRDMPNYYATKTYVGEQIANAQLGGGEGGSVDLSVYATKEYVDNAVANIEIPDVDLSAYATIESMNTALADKADAEHTHDEYLTEHQDISNLATKEELSTAINKINTTLGNIETLLGEI